MTKSRAKIISTSIYRSTTEQRWAIQGRAIMGALIGQPVHIELYEPVTLKLPGGSYTPDFLYVFDDGLTAFVEVKGSTKQRGYRDARAKLRAAAELYAIWDFYEVRPGATWTVEKITRKM